jgi:hypothetical protein
MYLFYGLEVIFDYLLIVIYSWSPYFMITMRHLRSPPPMLPIPRHYYHPPKYLKQIVQLQSISSHQKQDYKLRGHDRLCIAVILPKGHSREYRENMGFFRRTRAYTGQKDKSGLPHHHQEISLHFSSTLDFYLQTGSTLN